MKKKRKNIFSTYVLAVAVVVGIIITTVLLLQKPHHSSIEVANQDIQKVLVEVEELLVKKEKKYGARITFSEKGHVWWNTIDDYSIVNFESPTVSLKLFCDFETPIEAVTKQMAPKIRRLFLRHGFTINEHNTSKSYTDDQFYHYIEAYEKESLKCTLKSIPSCSTEVDETFGVVLSIACTDQYEHNRATQEPILKDLEIKNNIIIVRKSTENFLNLGVYARGGGHYMIAKLIDNKWENLFYGHEIPPCSLVNKHKIPSSIYETCAELW